MPTLTATYSPEDNKLRLYASSRLDAETYERVKAAGFIWAPRQELFVAPLWTPAREDLLIELCGEIGDEDTSLVDRAEDRADRFTQYRQKRTQDATAAHDAVSAITAGIPLGQPILVGHHSERRARKDAEKIQNTMRRAVQMWETAEYWQRRAAGALQHAKYKEQPAVRHRRIKRLEADKRKQERNKEEAQKWLKLWTQCEAVEGADLQLSMALHIAGASWLKMPRKEGDLEDWNQTPTAYDALKNTHPRLYAPRSLAEVFEVAKNTYPANIAHYDRWIAHYENRIAYERAMLDEQGGLKAEGFDIQVGGRVLIGGEWLVVMRVNKAGGKINSVTTNARFCRVRRIEEIKDYREPSLEDAAKVKKATKLPPLVNFPGEGFLAMTADEYKRRPSDYKGTRTAEATAAHGAYRYRAVFTFNGSYQLVQVYITDAKRVDPPAPDAAEPVQFERERALLPEKATRPDMAERCDEMNADFEAMRGMLKKGVQVVTAPQLFPTPPSLAARMVELADIERGHAVLEPSAGTGNILRAIREATNGGAVRTAIEINPRLCDSLRIAEEGAEVINCDFLQYTPPAGKFDRVLMNPPFVNADDIKHIKHALGMLKPGGKLVAICANGPRQNEQLRPLVEQMGGEWEDLPPGTFEQSGTGVNTALLTLTV